VTEIGTGVLTWYRQERVSDRYGTVYLLNMEPGVEVVNYYSEASGPEEAPLDTSPVGRRGRLCAEVVARGKSGHIGDLFHGLYPPSAEEDMPAIGSVHVLGEGTFFVDPDLGPGVGVRPDDADTRRFWLDPKVLYLLHEQGVRLFFEA
jgi:hypothetical protein